MRYAGVGLHSGNRVNMAFLPAPPNTGIRFRRIDLEDKPEIEARVENVAQTNRSTSLAKGNAKIQTVEHVLATFAGFRIDNAIIELDANEPPIADGSSRHYCKMIEDAGIVQQGEKRETYRVTTPLDVQTKESLVSIFPQMATRGPSPKLVPTIFRSLRLYPETATPKNFEIIAKVTWAPRNSDNLDNTWSGLP